MNIDLQGRFNFVYKDCVNKVHLRDCCQVLIETIDKKIELLELFWNKETKEFLVEFTKNPGIYFIICGNCNMQYMPIGSVLKEIGIVITSYELYNKCINDYISTMTLYDAIEQTVDKIIPVQLIIYEITNDTLLH
jgi:hypothetical protein